MCGPLLDPKGDRKIAIDDQIQALGKPARRWTEIGGRLTPDVASVRISYRRDGRKASGMATVAQVAGEIQRKLHQPSPFGYFDLRIRGRVPWRSIRVQAYDSAGAVLGTVGPASSSGARPSGSNRLARRQRGARLVQGVAAWSAARLRDLCGEFWSGQRHIAATWEVAGQGPCPGSF